MLTRNQAEASILKKLREIQEIYLRYNPTGDYLSMFITADFVSCNNAYWEKGRDELKPINLAEETFPKNRMKRTPAMVLVEYAKERGIHDFEIMDELPEDIQVGDVVTIQPACYDDLPRRAYPVDEAVTPYNNGEGWVICGFVFDKLEKVTILRRCFKNV